MSLTIKGESGKALDATSRDFATMRIRNASLRLATLEDDILEWTASTADVTAGTAPIPEVGQIVELYDGATRRFRGHALDPVYSLYGVQIRVVGPWWWMRGENAVSEQEDQLGNTADRPIVRFETGNLSTHFLTAITNMAAAGVPVQAGGIASTFNIPTVSYQVSSWADVIARLMEWIADGVAWLDYSGTGHPSLNISRRGSMSAETITIGTTHLDGSSFSFGQRTDLKASGVSIPFMERSPTTGFPIYDEQTAGTLTARETKIIPVSGPELLDFLPFDDFDSWEYTSGASIPLSLIWNLDPQFVNAKPLVNGSPFVQTVSVKSSTVPPLTFTTFNSKISLFTENGNEAGSFSRFITSPAPPPDWAIKKLGLVKLNAVGYAYYYYDGSNAIKPSYIDEMPGEIARGGYTPESTINFATSRTVYVVHFNVPIYGAPASLPTGSVIESTTATIINGNSGGRAIIQIANKSYLDSQYIGRPISIQALWLSGYPLFTFNYTIVSISGTTLTLSGFVDPTLNNGQTTPVTITRNTIAYRDLEYGFLNPPSGLADNLLAAQSWTPWEGGVTLKNKAAPNPQLLSKKWNVAGFVSDAATAGALLKSAELDLASYDLTLRWGFPNRLNYSSLVRQASARPQDTIIEV